MAPKKDTSNSSTDDNIQTTLDRIDANMTTQFTDLHTTLHTALTNLTEAITNLPHAISMAAAAKQTFATGSVQSPPQHPLSTSAIRPPKIHLPTFDGSNPLDWLFQATNYFEYYSIQPAQRISLAQFYFTGEALSWYKYLAKNQLLTAWSDFSRALELRFGPSSYENHQASLFKLQQTTTVTAYVAEFERLSNCVVGLPPEALLNCFISGLRSDIQQDLSVLKPSSFQQAVGLAKLLEEKAMAATVSPPPAVDVKPTSAALLPSSSTIKPALLPAPSGTTNSLPTARLSPDQLQQRRAAGLCFRCPEKYVPGHRCNPPQFLLIVDNTTDPPLIPPLTMDTDGSDVPHFLALSPAIFFGMSTATSMSLTGVIHDRPVSILVDSGSTHNLIQPHVASLLNLVVQPTAPFPVLVGNGEPLLCHGYCLNVPVTLNQTSFPVPLFLFDFKGCELILGFDWLRSLGPVTADFSVPSISFRFNNQLVTLRGSRPPTTAPSSGVTISDLEDKVPSEGEGIDTIHQIRPGTVIDPVNDPVNNSTA